VRIILELLAEETRVTILFKIQVNYGPLRIMISPGIQHILLDVLFPELGVPYKLDI
jgi:hypothetical protein